jgi:hypothetical protein
MTITRDWLEKNGACSEGVQWFTNQTETDSEKLVMALLAEEKFPWANWLLIQLMPRAGQIAYAIRAAELVLPAYEKQFPGDDRPRRSIEVAKSPAADASYAAYISAYAAAAAAHAAYVANVANINAEAADVRSVVDATSAGIKNQRLRSE